MPMTAAGTGNEAQAPAACEGSFDLLHRRRMGACAGAGRAAGVVRSRAISWSVGSTWTRRRSRQSHPRLVLDEAEQRRLHDSVVEIAERTSAAESEEAVLMRIRNALVFLVELRMREMVRDAREYELKALLTDLFGERAVAATVERLNARMDVEGLASP